MSWVFCLANTADSNSVCLAYANCWIQFDLFQNKEEITEHKRMNKQINGEKKHWTLKSEETKSGH